MSELMHIKADMVKFDSVGTEDTKGALRQQVYGMPSPGVTAYNSSDFAKLSTKALEWYQSQNLSAPKTNTVRRLDEIPRYNLWKGN